MPWKETWEEKAIRKRSSLVDLIPKEWRLPESILKSLPKDSTVIPSQCGILSELDLEITEIDDIDELARRISICFKDQFNIKGVETTMGYVGYLGDILEYNSILVDCVLSLGAVVYVKTTVPQTLMLAETRSNLLGVTVNPRNRELSCGGSSGGEGSLVALKGSICGFGTDIGGSVRTPAAVNGIYGLRPTEGRFPYGLVKNSLERQESVSSVVGPITRSLANVRTILKAIMEAKPWLVDPKVHNIRWREDMFQESQAAKLSFGVIRFDHHVHLSPPVQRAIDMAVTAL
ncbi:unnamed protein product [Rotaria sp. Silwood2]|nr:unnamed protein product [Rotaria sp. Silwood2]CAF2943944.1 unnamed protein product [Rotaria sp. Silwood2]CAF4380923.1 unnamed protein product [Rotaria sp. Silwood2]CAF4418713.1 unnamed protein product [Rotaria sp. Silwood2]